MTEATPLASEQITQDADELEALIDKATDCDLADEGRYFSETCNDLTSCRHGETGKYNDQHDGPLVEFLWNHRHHYLSLLRSASLSASPAPSGQGVSGEVDLPAAARLALMYLETGFIECPQCGHEVPTKDLDAVWQIKGALAAPAPSCAPGEVERALRWYAEQVAGCRKIGRAGDLFRQALDQDGGKRAVEALAALSPQGLDAKEGGE